MIEVAVVSCLTSYNSVFTKGSHFYRGYIKIMGYQIAIIIFKNLNHIS